MEPAARLGKELWSWIVAGLPGGKTVGEKVIVTPAMALERHSRRLPGPLSAVLVTVQVPATAAAATLETVEGLG